MSTAIAKNFQIGADSTPSNNFTLYQPATPDGTLRLGNGNTGITSSLLTLTSAGAMTVSGAVTTSALTVNGNNISAVNSLGFRNRIINGDMRIDQRSNGGSVTPNAGATYTVDRWSLAASQNARFSVQQNAGSVTPPSGFRNYLGATSLSAYSVTSTDYFTLQQNVEGFNVADLGWGAAGAQSVTVSFWVRSSLTGTFGGSINNNGSTRSYVFTYTINSANTWEFKTVVIPGDTTGTWLTTNGVGLTLNFAMGMGSTYSGAAGAWSGSALYSATGAVSVVGTNGATFYITGVQLEAGSVATPFERRDYGRELIMCQRYCEFQNFSYVTINYKGGGVYFKVTKRATPTMVFYSRVNRGGTVGSVQETNASGSDFVVTFSEPTADGLQSVGTGVTINATMSGSFIASAEL